ncbi:MAG: DUF6259 domain-containing protein [Candidatus Borkfalkiaceae bacterium]|nr:DUF6259 domain-containing protein [Clostridia bacterium]MDY6222792.1 DUF6259 domain-containing protein [Christensenellaceae bacterium]
MISGRTPMFFVKLRNALGAHRIVSSNECEFVSFDGEKAVYTHEAIGVTLIFKLRGAGLAVRIRIKNKTKDLIEWAQPFCFGLSGKLKDEGGAGEIVYPFNEGCLVTDMKKRMSMPFKYIEPEYPSLGKYSIFPNMICSQFIGYIKNGKGIYMGMHDKERTVKHIDFDYEKESIKLVMRTFCDTDFTQDYCMPFDLAIEFFEGDYFDCTEIYRKWFYKHLPAGLKKTDEESLPGWYEESPIVVTYPVRGKFDTDTMTPNPALYPYANALPFLGEISRQTGAKVMALLMHWEGTAPWAPPYVWPPYGGEKIFSEFIEKAHAEGILTGVYCSGMGWTQKSKLEDYSKEKQFKQESLKKIMCSDTNGDIKSEICTQQREGYDLCPAVKKCRDMLTEEYNKIVHSGVDYVQVFDQNHGGNSYFCYSRNHGHTPAPGKWQIKAVNEILNAIDRSRVLLGCESAAAEPFISALKFSDNRWNLNEYTGESIPLYAYLYHEFVNNFMGNQICMMLSDEEYNYTYRSAYSFLAGDMLTLVLRYDGVPVSSWGKNKKPLDESVVYPFLKELTLWRTHAGKDFLHKGKMIKPKKFFCGKNKFTIEDGSEISVDKVLTAAYRYKRKNAQFLVNYNVQPVAVNFETEVTLYTDFRLNEKRRVKTTELQPLSVAMIKI